MKLEIIKPIKDQKRPARTIIKIKQINKKKCLKKEAMVDFHFLGKK